MFDVFLHLVTNLFLAGRSEFKPLFLGVWILLVFFLRLFFCKKEFLSDKLAAVASILIVLSFIYPALLYVQKTNYLSIDPVAYTVTFSDSDFSSSSLLHNHIAKSAFSSIGYSFIDKDTIDAGGAYSWRINSFERTLILGSIILSTGAILMLLAYSSLSLPFFVVQILVGAMVVKNSVDGGLFNSETALALLVFGFLLSKNNKNILSPVFYILGFISTVIGLFISLSSGTINYVAHLLLTAFALAMLIIWATYNEYSKSWKRIVGSSIVGLICISLLALQRGSDSFAYAFSLINQDSMLTAPCEMYKENDHIKGKIGSICFGSLNKLDHGKRVANIAYERSIPFEYYPIQTAWKECIPSGMAVRQSMRIVSPDNMPLSVATSTFSTVSVSSVRKTKYGSEGVLSLVINPCVSMYENIIQQSLYSMGINKAIIIPSSLNIQNND